MQVTENLFSVVIFLKTEDFEGDAILCLSTYSTYLFTYDKCLMSYFIK
jgi:hypothetical protein